MKPLRKVKRQSDEPVLTGTFAAVMLLGGFLIMTWLAVFILFMIRS